MSLTIAKAKDCLATDSSFLSQCSWSGTTAIRRASAQSMLTALSQILHEPVREVRSLLKRNHRYLAQVEKYRNRKLPAPVIKNHVRSFSFEQRDDYQQLLQSDNRSRLIVSFHFGDFIYGPNVLAALEGADRQQYFLTQRASTPGFLANWRAAFGSRDGRLPKQLIVSDCSATQLVRLLRTPNTSLLTFADLPPGFGRSANVQFLQAKANFPSGPATLSVLAQVPILPVLNLYNEGKNQIIAFPQIEPEPDHKGSRAEVIQHLTQKLARFLELAIQECPWQWRYLSMLPLYLAESQ